MMTEPRSNTQRSSPPERNQMTTLLDYEPPPSRPPKGGPGWFFVGLVGGMLISVVGWLAVAKNVVHTPSGKQGDAFALGLVVIPVVKIALGFSISRSPRKSTFLSGIVTSIALAPLIGIGLVYAACARLI